MTTVVGIDPSVSATGCAVWRNGIIDVHTAKSDTKAIWPVRWAQIKSTIASMTGLSTYAADDPEDVMFVIEQPPAKFVGPAAALPNHGLYAILIDWWWSSRYTYVDIQPTQLKKFATGKGAGPGASKEGVLLAIDRTYGHLVKVHNNNEADAVSLMAMGLYWYGMPLVPDLPTAHTERLQHIAWPEWHPTSPADPAHDRETTTGGT